MATHAQIAANQANAQLSTGPRTPAGKARVAANSIDHGFRSASVLIPGDDPAEFDALRAAIREEYEPETYEQTRCAEEMAASWWRLQRARAFENDILTRKIGELHEAHPGLAPTTLACRAEEELHRDSKYYLSLLRYEARFDRQYERARRTLRESLRDEQRSAAGQMTAAMEAILNAPIPPPPAAAPPQIATSKPNPPAPQTPRGAPCPCGSGEKFKRCCGQNAPPVYHFKA
jgi:hypothetical protein